MIIGIHHREGSFSDHWITFCEQQNLKYKLVNCFDNNIMEQLQGCNILLWHYHHAQFKDRLVASKILFSLEHSGIKVFPDFRTAWHFDDKVAQKYLLESIRAPLIESYVFYNKGEALQWCAETSFPKVFKLKGGASARNVRLIKTKKEAIRLVQKAFGRGFKQFDGWSYFKEVFRAYSNGSKGLSDLAKAFARIFVSTDFAKEYGRDKGYIYFQEFIEGNNYDVRVIVINGDKAYGMKRMVRPGDFRASGSGNFKYDPINEETLKIVFDVASKLDLQSVAFDIVYRDKQPLIVEMSYGFGTEGSSKCPGYWDKELNFHKGPFDPINWILEDLVGIKANRFKY